MEKPDVACRRVCTRNSSFSWVQAGGATARLPRQPGPCGYLRSRL